MMKMNRNMTYNMSYSRKFNTSISKWFGILTLFIVLFSACKKDEVEIVKVPVEVKDYYPNSGNQGTLVTIEGTGFPASPNAITATFGGAAADVVSATSTAIVLRAPAGGRTGEIVMKVNNETLNIGTYTYQELSVQTISPANGAAGAHIRITGAGFSSTNGPAEVYVNGKLATVVSASDNLLVAEVPEGAGTGPVTVKVDGKEASGQIFKFQVISGIKPASGGKGTHVKITGGGFDEVLAGNFVDFNGKQAMVLEATADYLVVVAPEGVQTGPVSVTINNQKAAGPMFTLVPMPVIETVTPLSGPAGTEMTITGLNFSTFTDENKVTVNGKQLVVLTATSFKLTLSIPGGTGDGKVILNVNDQIVQGPDFKDQGLGIAGLSPDNGLAGTEVTITGTGFNTNASANTVTFNGVTAQVISATATSLVVIAPTALTTGPVKVVNGGQNAISPVNFNRAGVMTLAGGPGKTDLSIRDRGASIAVDSHGNVFVMELTNHVIKKITPQGVVSVFAGTSGQTGNQNGTGTSASFNFSYISGMVIDKQDVLYITDGGNSSVRKITPAGVVSTYAVNLTVPGKLAIDDNGDLYVQTQYSLTKVDKAGVRSVVRGFNGGNEQARPVIIGSFFYYTDNDNLLISRFDLSNGTNQRSWAGDGNFGNSDGPKNQSMLVTPRGYIIDGQGNFYFSDGFSQTTRKINMILNEISTVSRQPARGYKDGGLNEAEFSSRDDMAIDKDGNIYIVDQGNNAIRKMFLK
ncbi:IPT/TIG domain-containing protein [Pedobacter nyackensis]|uniref:IPT/TIG domain-containing protein n=2 Tax=Pedobacter nyackensis TaxID=475255 RepID=A0A1W2CXV7_9SPHI|nr:IPT/TIG domain-containing protein [Pedobacter nyackensis]